MKKLGVPFGWICVALLLVLGLLLPQLTFLLQDRQLAQDVTRREDTGVSLVMNPSPDIFDALALFREANTEIELSEGKNLTQEEAIQAGAAVMDLLAEAGGSPPLPGIPKAVPVLFTVKESPERAGIFWRCFWEMDVERTSTDGLYQAQWVWGESIWIDDETGKLVGATNLHWRSPVQTEQDLAQSNKADYVRDLIEFVDWFCEEQYGLEGVTSMDTVVSSKSGQFSFLLSMEDEQGETKTYLLPVSAWDNKLNVND